MARVIVTKSKVVDPALAVDWPSDAPPDTYEVIEGRKDGKNTVLIRSQSNQLMTSPVVSWSGNCVKEPARSVTVSYARTGASFTVSVSHGVDCAGTSTYTLTALQPPLGLTIEPSQVAGGKPAKAVVWLTSAAGADAKLKLSASDSAVTVPASVTLSAKKGYKATFEIKTAPVPQGKGVTITAALGSLTQTAILNVVPR